MVSTKSGSRAPVVAFIDIETSPNLGYVWGKWEQNVIRFKEEWHLLSFAVKYLGSKKVHVYGLPDFPLYKKDKENDHALAEKLWEVMDGADIVVAHNGDRFDIPKINARFAFHAMQPPSPYKALDTKKIAKRYFKFDSNSLNDLGAYLKLGQKLSHTGFQLWLDCMAGSMKAWNLMKRYNGQDVILLEQIFLRFRPWMTNHPNMNAFSGKKNACPKCESTNLHKRGFRMTVSGRQERFQCQDCGGWGVGKAERTGITVKQA